MAQGDEKPNLEPPRIKIIYPLQTCWIGDYQALVGADRLGYFVIFGGKICELFGKCRPVRSFFQRKSARVEVLSPMRAGVKTAAWEAAAAVQGVAWKATVKKA